MLQWEFSIKELKGTIFFIQIFYVAQGIIYNDAVINFQIATGRVMEKFSSNIPMLIASM